MPEVGEVWSNIVSDSRAVITGVGQHSVTLRGATGPEFVVPSRSLLLTWKNLDVQLTDTCNDCIEKAPFAQRVNGVWSHFCSSHMIHGLPSMFSWVLPIERAPHLVGDVIVIERASCPRCQNTGSSMNAPPYLYTCAKCKLVWYAIDAAADDPGVALAERLLTFSEHYDGIATNIMAWVGANVVKQLQQIGAKTQSDLIGKFKGLGIELTTVWSHGSGSNIMMMLGGMIRHSKLPVLQETAPTKLGEEWDRNGRIFVVQAIDVVLKRVVIATRGPDHVRLTPTYKELVSDYRRVERKSAFARILDKDHFSS